MAQQHGVVCGASIGDVFVLFGLDIVFLSHRIKHVATENDQFSTCSLAKVAERSVPQALKECHIQGVRACKAGATAIALVKSFWLT